MEVSHHQDTKFAIKCNKPNHQKEPIQSICLNEKCKGNRYLCKHCFFEHRLHLISTLSGGEFDPLSILSINSQKQNSLELKNKFKERYQTISKNFFGMFYQIVDEHRLYFKQQLQNQFEALWGSFDKQTSIKAIETIRKHISQQLGEEVIDKSIEMLNVLMNTENNIDIRSNSSIEKVINYHQFKLKQINQNITTKLKSIFSSIAPEIQKLKIQNLKSTDLQLGKPQENLINKKDIPRDDNKTLEIKKSFSEQSKQIIKKVKKRRNTHKHIQPEDQQFSGKLTPSKKIKFREQYQQCSNSQNLNLVSENKKTQTKQFNQSYKNVPGLYIEQRNQRIGALAIISEFQLGTVKQICEALKARNVKQLVISSNCKPKVIRDDCISLLCQVQSLRSIRIQWANQLSLKSILNMINSLHLTSIIFQNCSNFNPECVDAILKKTPKIKTLHYGVDFRKSLKQYHQSLYFMEQDRDYSLNNDDSLKLADLKNLTNIWVGECSDKTTTKIIQKIKTLKDLILGEFIEDISNLRQDSIEALGNHPQIQSLTLLNISNCGILKKPLSRLKSIESLVFIGCKQIDDQLLTIVNNNCKSITQLSFDTCEININGQQIWEITKLRTLILSKVKSINRDKALLGLPNLLKLQFLDLRQNEWVDDNIAKSLNKLKMLKYLSIAVTNITDVGLQSLGSLKNLEVLICGHTKINGSSIRNFSKQCRKIKKLSIAGLDGSDGYGLVTEQDMKEISENLQITHLNIYKCGQFTDKTVLNFDKLICITLFGSKVTNQCKSILRYKGIYVEDKE